jgi:hypothetical protein
MPLGVWCLAGIDIDGRASNGPPVLFDPRAYGERVVWRH